MSYILGQNPTVIFSREVKDCKNNNNTILKLAFIEFSVAICVKTAFVGELTSDFCLNCPAAASLFDFFYSSV